MFDDQTPWATISRRGFLAGLGLLSGSAAVLAAEQTANSPAPVKQLTADVLVVGGGTAGTIAAIQAGRLKARTILVEAGSQLGGTMTTGGVSFPGLFCAWGRQIIAGVGWELVKQAVELHGDKLPDFSKSVGEALRHHPNFQVRLRGGLYAALAEEACLAAGVALRYYEFPLSVKPVQDGWRVEVAGKGTQAEIRCRTLIDWPTRPCACRRRAWRWGRQPAPPRCWPCNWARRRARCRWSGCAACLPSTERSYRTRHEEWG